MTSAIPAIPAIVDLGRRWVAASHASTADAITAVSFPARVAVGGGARGALDCTYSVGGLKVVVGSEALIPGVRFSRDDGLLGLPDGVEDALLVLHALRQLSMPPLASVALLGQTEDGVVRIVQGIDYLSQTLDLGSNLPWPATVFAMPLSDALFAAAHQPAAAEPQCVIICDDEGSRSYPVTDGPTLTMPGVYRMLEQTLLDHNGAVQGYDPAALAMAWGDTAAMGQLPPEVAGILDESVQRSVEDLSHKLSKEIAILRSNYQTAILIGPDARLMGAVVKSAGLAAMTPQLPERSFSRYALRAYIASPDRSILHRCVLPVVGPPRDQPRTRTRQPVIVKLDPAAGTVTIRLELGKLDPSVQDLLRRFARSTRPGPEAQDFLHSIIDLRRR